MRTNAGDQNDGDRSRLDEVEGLLEERDRLIHDLEVHQAELEAQNQQLREAHDLLEESRARYSDLYDFAPVAYCTLDVVGRISEINLTGAAMLEHPRSRLIGKSFALFLVNSDRAVFRDHLHRRLASQQGDVVCEVTVAGRTRPPIVIQLVSGALLDRTGQIVGCRSAFTDITEQRRAHEALHAAVRAREDLLATVSHELRNPLNSITLGSEVLRMSATLSPQDKEKVTLVLAAAHRMRHMLSDLLDLSSMEAGHLSMERRSDRVATLLAATIEGARSAAAQRGVHLEIAPCEPDLVAYCDPDRIRQVLVNLVGNAIKFSTAGGSVRLAARRIPSGVEMAVRDSGTGIAKEQLDHVFDAYWQAKKTAKQGTGLGLSIARGIVEFHGGRIWAESEPDRGSTFYFTIPDQAEQAATPELDATPPVRSRALSGRYPAVVTTDTDRFVKPGRS